MRGEDVTILVVGPALAGDGYPNANNTLALLRTEGFAVRDVAYWLPHDFHLWKLAGGTVAERLRGLLLLGAGTAQGLLALVRYARHAEWVYLPYPSMLLLWSMSWLPRSWRPRFIADAYITLWDSFYQDRKLGISTSWISRLLKAAESRALRAAESVIVDTLANAAHVSEVFSVDPGRIHAFPLAIKAELAQCQVVSRSTAKDTIRILFIGTFVPLQGADVIARAIQILAGRYPRLEFVIVGDGQQAEAVEALLGGEPAVIWKRGWQPAEVLSEELSRADICLGVFGGAGKASRVLPFKLYLALAAGKAIITQEAYSTPDGNAIPARTVAPEPQALAEAIASLSNDAAGRLELGIQAREYYLSHLSSKCLADAWASLLSETSNSLTASA